MIQNININNYNDDKRRDFELWNLLEKITCKDNWYEKIFNTEIVNIWKKEYLELNKSSHIFYHAVKILQSTSQGIILSEECEWNDESDGTCSECISSVTKYDKTIDPNEADLYDILEILRDNDHECEHIPCKCISPNSDLNSYIYYESNGLLNKDLHDLLKLNILNMMDKIPIDWHPGSDEMVRDLIHPSMYCYVKGYSIHIDGKKYEESVNEAEVYQWLPSDFNVSSEGNVKLLSYINNLDNKRFDMMENLIERTVENAIPGFEKILSTSLKNKNLQIIVKIGSTHLTKDKSSFKGGSWHIEGMLYERICASFIHYIKVEGITDSYLEFRKPTIINEEVSDYPQSDSKYTEHHYGIENHFAGVMNRYLGLVKCKEGSSVVFPNSIQHRVKDFELDDNFSFGNRVIIALFLIDPDTKIISTSDIHPQQKYLASDNLYNNIKLNDRLFDVDEANLFRKRLMYHRKYFVDELNKNVYERDFSLCEH